MHVLEIIGIICGSGLSALGALKAVVAVVRWGASLLRLLASAVDELVKMREELTRVRLIQRRDGRRIDRLETISRRETS